MTRKYSNMIHFSLTIKMVAGEDIKTCCFAHDPDHAIKTIRGRIRMAQGNEYYETQVDEIVVNV